MIRVGNAKKQNILDTIDEQKISYVYLYIDLINEDIETGNTAVWVKEQCGSISQVVLKYHDSFQLYSEPSLNEFDDLIKLIHAHQPLMISGSQALIEQLYLLIGTDYEASYGKVLKQLTVAPDPVNNNVTIETATYIDMADVARMICSDESIGGHYRLDDLREQLEERYREKSGRNIIIRSQGSIAAHYGTYAEAKDIAVMGGMIVKPEYRGRGYAQALHLALSGMLLKDGKIPVLFCTSPNTEKTYIRLGAVVHSLYGKLTRRLEGI